MIGQFVKFFFAVMNGLFCSYGPSPPYAGGLDLDGAKETRTHDQRRVAAHRTQARAVVRSGVYTFKASNLPPHGDKLALHLHLLAWDHQWFIGFICCDQTHHGAVPEKMFQGGAAPGNQSADDCSFLQS